MGPPLREAMRIAGGRLDLVKPAELRFYLDTK
jgi:hypothetical protein